MSIPLHFEKVSRFDRDAEPCSVAIPFAEGHLAPETQVCVFDGEQPVPTQSRPTATWPDGSIKWLLVHFLADLPGNAGKDFECRIGAAAPGPPVPVAACDSDGRCTLDTGPLEVSLARPGEMGLLHALTPEGSAPGGLGQVTGPTIDVGGTAFVAVVDENGWQVVEPGPVCMVTEGLGKHRADDGSECLDFIARVSLWAGKPWLELSCKVVNRESSEETIIEEMSLGFEPERVARERTKAGITTSNYRSSTVWCEGDGQVHKLIAADFLVYQSNEQMPEVNYGTFTGHWSQPESGGLSATIHQAYQNYPKALTADAAGLRIGLVPPGAGGLRLIRGVAKTHRMLLHCHDGTERSDALIVRGLQYQMPDRPILPAETYRAADVLPDVFVERPVPRVERYLTELADRRTRGYGMLNWGDGPERGYTDQGRGKGEVVWANHEYDLPRAAMLMFARTGERRMLDYLLVAAQHWMDVDVCHHSPDPFRHQGMITHSARHATGGVTISHEWVEGLLDCYHQTGDSFALDTALGVGENVLRHLARTVERGVGTTSARETGWALRTLVALYEETHDERWLTSATGIVDHFQEWMAEYGAWLAPYTDHTLVRVPFMITVAVNSLMCYYRVRPEQRVADMVVRAEDDLIENCLTSEGLFYYKELPSLRRLGAGLLNLEGLSHAYNLTDDDKYLRAGLPTFNLALRTETAGYSGAKFVEGDAVIYPAGPGPKAFAASFFPAMSFYKAAVEAGLIQANEEPVR